MDIHQFGIKYKKGLEILLGLGLCLLIVFISIYIADFMGLILIKLSFLSPGSPSPVSNIFISITIGLLARNTIGLKEYFLPGINFSLKYALRIGIMLLGLRLSLMDALKLGAIGIPLIFICILAGVFITTYLTNKFNFPYRLGLLIATGTSICGVTAIMATAPVIQADENEVSYAVANITVFGITGIILYPFLANFLFGNDPVIVGLLLGTVIHDTAQVTGAALIYDQVFQTSEVTNVAMVTKLTRNLFIIGIIPLISYLYYSKHKMSEYTIGDVEKVPKWYSFIPLFVLGFLFLSFLRTFGDGTLRFYSKAFWIVSEHTWDKFYTNLSSFGTTYLMGLAMAAIGLNTNFKTLKEFGLRPFYMGFFSAIAVGIVSIIIVSIYGYIF